MNHRSKAFVRMLACACVCFSFSVVAETVANSFRVTPYVQHPTKEAVTLMWLAQTNGTASVAWWVEGSAVTNEIASAIEIDPSARVAGSRFTAEGVLQYCLAPELSYTNSVEAADNYPAYTREGVGSSQEGAGWSMPYTVPYQYRVRLTGLQPDTRYGYRVTLDGGATYVRTFRTAPAGWRNIKFTLYSDSETEPADNPLSTGRTKDWTDPVTKKERTYYATQSEAYASNVAAVVAFKPDFMVMAGDLAQKGSRQNDWDEFWRHNAGPLNDPAGSLPIFASPGNHDYWSYNDGGETAMRKYLSYFEYEPNGAAVDDDIQERFHRVDYGPATFLFMDANNGDDSDGTKDTNRPLARGADGYSTMTAPLGRGCRAPDFNVGSAQYQWLETQLADAQKKSAFIFVVSHQCPYSVGDHGRMTGDGGEKWSGQPLRVLEPLFHRYGVTAWLCGHDEMMERSEIYGTETLTNGTTRPHTMQIWDMGIAGDGLRGQTVTENAAEQYRAGKDSVEQYDEQGILVDGGKHYGHLEVTITNRADGAWVATFDPVYEFFTTNAQGEAVFGGTRHYPDLVTIVNTDMVQDAPPVTRTWVGTDGVWAKAENWSPEGVPQAMDRVVIGQSVQLTPTTYFAGEFVVTSGTLTLNAESDLSVSLAVKTGARIEKRGAGNVRAVAIPVLEAGFVTDGAIRVAEGTMTFASAGQSEAPGFFGPLEVAAGAVAAVADSPAAGRHGALIRSLTTPYGTASSSAMNYFTSLVDPLNVPALTARWAEVGTDPTLSSDGYWRHIAKDVDGVYPFSDCPKALSALVNKNSIVLCSRALLVAPGGKVDFYYWMNNRVVPIVDGTRLTVDRGNGLAEVMNLSAGWHSFDEPECRINGSVSPNSRCFYQTDAGVSKGVMDEDALWSGVAFGGLTLAEGATLSVAAGQAVAIAGAGASVTSGRIVTGAGAVFALMSGTWTTDWDCFTDFAGTFELGRRATLTPGDADLTAFGGAIEWRGTVVASSGLTGLQTGLTGTLYVPADVTVAADEALLTGASVTGPGRVAVASEVSVAAAKNSQSPIELQTGGKIASTFDDLTSRPKTVTLPGLDDPTAWWISSNNVAAGTAHAGGRLADGKLTLVDAPGMQCAAAWIQNQTIGAKDNLDVSFKWQQSMCDYPEYGATASINNMAEGMIFLLQGMGLSIPGQDPPRTGCNGIEIYGYQGMHFYWVVGGTSVDKVKLDGAGNYKFVIGEPTSVRVGFTNGVMTATFSQANGATYTSVRNLQSAFMSYDKLYMGFTGGTGTSKNYFKGDVWDFAGTVATTEAVTGDVPDATQSVSTDNWQCWRGAMITNDTQLFIQPVNPSQHGHVICQNPLSPYVPFTLEFDMIFEMNEGSGYWAEGWGFSFIDDPQADNWDGGAPYVMKAHNGMSFGDYTYQGHHFKTWTMINNAKTELQGSDANPNGVNQTKSGEQNPMHVTVVYDGAGTFTVTYAVAALGASYTQTQYFDNYTDMNDDRMYLAFASAPGSGIHWVVTRADNLALSHFSDNGPCPVTTPISVAAGASATLETYSLAPTATHGECLADLTLGLGSTLATALSEGLLGGWLGLDRVTSDATSTVASGTGLTTALDTIVLTGDVPGPLTVTGDWGTKNGTLTFVLPAAWRRASGFYVLRADLARCQDAQPPAVVVTDEAGHRLRFAIDRRADGIVLSRRGVAVFVR